MEHTSFNFHDWKNIFLNHYQLFKLQILLIILSAVVFYKKYFLLESHKCLYTNCL